MNTFQNPQKLPVEDLYLKLDSSNSSHNGVVLTIKALDKHWALNEPLSRYERPPSKSNLFALQEWKERMKWFDDDLTWMLSIKYHVFWSNIIYNSDCLDALVSFLQEGNPPYLQPYEDTSVSEIYSTIFTKVIHVFLRLIRSKESETEWMKESFLASLLYDKFIFTVPIIFDICLLYGTHNLQTVIQIVNSVFSIQPNYLKDMKTAIAFIQQMFKFITIQVNPSSINQNNNSALPEGFGGISKSLRSLGSLGLPDKKEPTASPVDLVLYLLDSCLTIKIFLECNPESVGLFRDLEYHLSIVQLYENAIPDLYKKLEEIDGCSEDSETSKHLDLARLEMIDTVRLMLEPSIEDILSDKEDKETHVNSYLAFVMDCLSEKYFICDYQKLHPVDVDLDIIGQAHSDIDLVKSNFILQAIYSTFEDEEIAQMNAARSEQTDVIPNEYTNNLGDASNSDRDQNSEIPEDLRNESLISEVKDIMPHLGDGYVLKCLEFYGFNAERVINSILEGTLDKSLQKLDESMPLIPVDILDKQFVETGIDRLNIYDNDEFDIMTNDNIALDKVHKGKRRSKFKNLSEMLNDKSHVKALSNVYSKFSVISDETEGGNYSDEYDDTYDSADVTSHTGRRNFAGISADDTDYTQRRAFVTPRILRARSESEDEEEETEEGPPAEVSQRPRDAFCINPEEIRERRAQQRGAANVRGPPRTNQGNSGHRNADVVGRAKGQGQEKEVVINRDKKNVNKSSRANHNRRAGAQWKRSQGFIPS